MNKKRIISLSLILVLFLSVFTFAAPAEPAWNAFDQRITARVDEDRMVEHIRVLSEDIGPRVAGQPAEWEAAQYIYDTLISYGYEAEIQEFVSRTTVNRSLRQISPMEQSYPTGSFTGSGVTEASGITAEIVYCGLGIEDDDFPADVEGNIALIERGAITFGLKTQNAIDNGAIGVIIFNNTGSAATSGTLGANYSIPVLGISRANGLALLEILEEEPVVMNMAVTVTPTATSPNVIGYKPTNNKKASDQIVLFTSHLDSAANAPGANDNASGVAGNLEMARILRGDNSSREVRFVFLGAEEIGLVGAYAYVASLPEEELEKIVAVYNMDMIGTSWREEESILIAWTSDGQRNIVTDTAIAAGARMTTAVLPARTTRSDHHAFHQVGIPAACFLRLPLEPYYHRPTDTIEMNLSPAMLKQSVQIVGAAAYELIRRGSPSLENSKIGEVIRDVEANLDLLIEQHMEAYEGVYVPVL
ncbi:MAG: M20/M25/M40 family metallo-hydrolase [Bacillota bacterium]|nr:M20/M25/M40 family metallo-hydrolase [Bacillota bacterium]